MLQAPVSGRMHTLSLSGDASGSASFDGSATLRFQTVANNSHNHTIANITSLQNALDGKLSTTGTAADSTKRGYKFSTSSTGSASNRSTLVTKLWAYSSAAGSLTSKLVAPLSIRCLSARL